MGRDHGVEHTFRWGAALDNDGVWTALIESEPLSSFAQVLLLSARGNAPSVDVLVESDSGGVARRAKLFSPEPTVWRIDGTSLVAAESTPIETCAEPVVGAEVADLLDIDDVDLIVEHGEITGECRGLEVARVVSTPDRQRLDVGVGAYDQGAFAVMNPHLTLDGALSEVVDQVLTHRRRGAEPHPLNRLVRERWIRSELLLDPTPLGLTELRPVEGVVPRLGLNDVAPAFAVGADAAGATVLVACSVGIDLDAVPSAADLAAHHRANRILLVLPERDQHPLVLAVAERSVCPCQIVTADEPWV